jgi:MinD-like ATPase involved in chromosome partitioning or flagellar assembly
VNAEPVRCVLATADPALAAACEAAADAATGIEVIASVPRSRVLAGAVPACDVLLVADAPGAPGAGWAEQAARACPGVAVVLLAEDGGVQTYRTALRIGACAVAPLPVSPAALGAAVADAMRSGGARPRTGVPARGEVIAVAAACGGVGASLVSLALAAAWRGLLVDLAGSRAGLTFALGASRDRSLADLAQAGEALAAGIGTVAVEHPAGLRFVPGPPDPDVLLAVAPGWGLELVREIRIRELVAVLDTGQGAAGPAREAVVAADRLFVVVTPARAALEAARSLVLDAVRWGIAAEPELVVNRWSRRADVGVHAIARMVDAPVAAVLPDAPRAMSGYDGGRVDVRRLVRNGPLARLADSVHRRPA